MRGRTASARRGRHPADPGVRRASRRVGALAALLVVGGVVLTATVLFAVYSHQTAVATADALTAAAHVGDPASAPFGTYVTTSEGGVVRSTPGMPAGLPDLEDLARVASDGRARQHAVDDDARGQYLVVRTTREGGRTIQVVLDGTAVEESNERVLLALLLAGGVGLVIAAGVAGLLTRRAVQPLAATVALQRQFVADASHELRTPLTLLSTRAQLVARQLRREQPDGSGTRGAQAVVDDVLALASILDDLLLAADGSGPRRHERVDLAQTVASVVGSAAARADDIGIRLSAVLPEHRDAASRVVLAGSPTALRRAVTALVDNALEHAVARVVVRLEVVGRDLVLTVADDGPGIPPDELGAVFRRFHRSRAPAAEVDGTPGRRHYGIGLALVSDVVAHHRGRVTVSRDGDLGGARFRVVLPATDA